MDNMDETPTETDTLASEVSGAVKLRKGLHPASLANLRPPWRPGVSGNPSGLTKDGLNPQTHAIEARLLRKLTQPTAKGSDKTWADRIVDGWVKAAAKGDAAARRDILERLYQIPEADKTAGRVILEGLRLELTPTGGAQVTMTRAALPGSEALAGESESRAGGAPTGPVDVPLLSSTPVLEGVDVSPMLGTNEYQVVHSDDATPTGVSGEAVRVVRGGPEASAGAVLPGVSVSERQEDGSGAAGGAEGAQS